MRYYGFLPTCADTGDNDSRCGWTFIESIIVITIILILTGTVGVAGIRYVERARTTGAAGEIAALTLALDGYYLDNAVYPTEIQGLKSLWEQPSAAPIPEDWNGPYVSKNDFTDPWNRDYNYRVPGPYGLPFEIRSFGADGKEGGEDKDADIVSWEN